MKLYYSKGACSLAVRIIIHELGLACDFEAVNLKTKETATGADFLKINPKGAVPTLVLTEMGQTLTENNIIQLYLAEHHAALSLLPPPEDFMRYRVLEWLNYITTDLHKSFGPLFNPLVPEDVKERVFIPLLIKKFTYVDKMLNKNKYLLGDEFTLPDAYLFVVTRWLSAFKIDLAQWPNLARHFHDLQKRKAVRQALLEEGLIKE